MVLKGEDRSSDARDGESILEHILGEHAKASGNLCQVTARNQSRGLIADTELEASWAPVDKLDSLSNISARGLQREVTLLTLCNWEGTERERIREGGP